MTSNNTINRDDFFIKEEEILKDLKFSKDQLEDLLKDIKSNQFDWKEGEHFRYVHKSRPERDFSRFGLFTISEYFNFIGESDRAQEVTSLLKKLTEENDENRIKIEITENTHKALKNPSNKIVLKGNRHWLKFSDVRKILNTTSSRLKQAFEDIARSELPLIVEEDFDDIDGERHYSYTGLDRICRELSNTLTDKYRRWYAKRVPQIAPDVIEKKSQRLLKDPGDNEINQAKKYALNQQKICQITGTDKSQEKLVVHHLYDRSTYFDLAADPDNLIVITNEIHQRFHTWHEGFDKACTIDDFIYFIRNHKKYMKPHVLNKLYERRETLQNKLKYRSKFRQLEPGSTTAKQTQPKTDFQPTTSKPTDSQQQAQGKGNSESSANEKDRTSVTNSLLGQNCSAFVRGKKVQGIILAIAKDDSVNYIRICFQVNNEDWGIWINESDLIEE